MSTVLYIFIFCQLTHSHYQMHFCRLLDLTGHSAFNNWNLLLSSLCMIKNKAWTHNKTNSLLSSSYGIVAIAPFSHRLAFDNLPSDIQHLRCKVNFNALVFVPHVRTLGDTLVSRLRSPPSMNKASSATHFHDRENDRAGAGKYVVLHLRFDKVWLSSTLLTQFHSYNHSLDYAWSRVCVLGLFNSSGDNYEGIALYQCLCQCSMSMLVKDTIIWGFSKLKATWYNYLSATLVKYAYTHLQVKKVKTRHVSLKFTWIPSILIHPSVNGNK